jgi:mRNA interferase RelE/StbE
MAYILELKKRVLKDIESLPLEIQQRILEEIAELLVNPLKHGVIKLTDQDSYRTRVGNYRIVFSVDVENQVLTLVTVDHRNKVYKK